MIRLVVYSLDERFNLDRSAYNYGTCFRNEDTCAEQFLETHVNRQIFNRDLMDEDKPKEATDHPRVAFQTFGTDFAFQDAQSSFTNAEQVLNNLERYLNKGLKYEFSTMTEMHERFHDHFDFKKVLPGDMLAYTERNNDSWSGYYGSKPDLKYHIRRVFNAFRAAESLVFVVKVEFERLKKTTVIQPTEKAR